MWYLLNALDIGTMVYNTIPKTYRQKEEYKLKQGVIFNTPLLNRDRIHMANEFYHLVILDS